MNSRVWRAIELIVFEVGALRMLIKDPCAQLNEGVRSASQSMKWLKIRNGVQLSPHHDSSFSEHFIIFSFSCSGA